MACSPYSNHLIQKLIEYLYENISQIAVSAITSGSTSASGGNWGHYLGSAVSPKGKTSKGLEKSFPSIAVKPTLNLQYVTFGSNVGTLKNTLCINDWLFCSCDLSWGHREEEQLSTVFKNDVINLF